MLAVLALTLIASTPCPARSELPKASHGLQLVWTCDSTAARTLTLRLQRGRHRVVWHRPEILLEADVVAGGAPDSVRIRHRSQTPQVPSGNVLVLRTADGRTLRATARAAHTDVQVQTTDLWLTFVVSRAELAALRDAERGELEVDGVRTELKAKHFAGLRDWLVRVEGS